MAELIVALDLGDAPSAIELLDLLPERIPVKVGSVLMTRAGSGLIRGLVDQGHPVFLDLKWHDIPNTVAGAVSAAVELGVEMITVHALGGEKMMTAALTAAAGQTKVVAVTVLTSHAAPDWRTIVDRDAELSDEVLRLATIARSAGVDGVVCSPHEVGLVSALRFERLVVPGVRRAGDDLGDQQRVATPSEAVAAGATHLVVGRPITAAPDPAEAYRMFQVETTITAAS
jgi:orotidine-5'-phosphate decarboxylase